MTPPSVRVNTFFQSNDDVNVPFIDFISKIFILFELPLGIVRLTLFRNIKTIYVTLSIIYSVLFVSFVTVSVYSILDFNRWSTVILFLCSFQYMFLVIFNLILNKRLEFYYEELKKFNIEVGVGPKIVEETIRNMIQLTLLLVYIFFAFSLSLFDRDTAIYTMHNMPAILTHNLELYFYGHLLSLFIPRLRFIKHCMRSADFTNEEGPKRRGNNPEVLCKMKKIMNLYHIVIKAHNFMIDATKWQLLVILIVSFVNMLYGSYYMSLTLIRGSGNITSFLLFLVQVSAVLTPLFALCAFGDKVHGEVQQFRELLSSRLYGDQLDKESRGIARALLAWTETRDLSFRLLRMFSIDISLPFKFIGLLITYLIILLQFEKVINP